MCVWLSQRRRERCTTSCDAPRAAQRCMAMRGVWLASAVSWPQDSSSVRTHRSKEIAADLPAWCLLSRALRLSRRHRLFLSVLVSYLPLARLRNGVIRQRSGPCRRASYNERLFLYAIAPRRPVPRSAPAWTSLHPENVKTLRSPAQVVRRVPRAQRRRRQPPKQIVDGPSRRRRLPVPTARGRIQVPVHGVEQRRP